MNRERGWPACRLAARALAVATLACLVLAAAGTPGRAQTGSLQTELERTDAILQHTAELVERSGNPRAAELMQFAMRSQGTAWEHFRAGRPLLAAQHTRQARELAQRATELVRRGSQQERHAQRLLEDAARALDRARECAGEPPSPPVMRRIEMAAERLERAREALHEQKYPVAADMAEAALKLLGGICAGSRRDSDRPLDDLRRLLERATEVIGAANDRAATAMLEQAGGLVQRAEELHAAGHIEASRRSADQARDLLLAAMRRTERPPDPAAVDRALQETRAWIDDLSRQIRAVGEAQAVTLIERAEAHLERAGELRQQDRLRQALAEIRVARNLGRRAAQLAGIRQL